MHIAEIYKNNFEVDIQNDLKLCLMLKKYTEDFHENMALSYAYGAFTL